MLTQLKIMQSAYKNSLIFLAYPYNAMQGPQVHKCNNKHRHSVKTRVGGTIIIF